MNEFSPPDVIHAHGYIAGIAACYISKKTQIPFVITEHSSNIVSGTVRKSQRSSLRIAYDHASGLIAVGKSLQEGMQKWTKKPIRIIPNLVNTELFNPQKHTNGAHKYFCFIVVGGLDRLKRVFECLVQFHQFSQVNKKAKLKFVGSGPEEKRLKKFVHKQDLNERVEFTGNLQMHEVAQEMCKADALITVSKIETFGKVIIEALACGLPVVTAESADPERIIHSGNGIRIPSDLSTLPEAMTEMVEFAPTVDSRQLHEDVKAIYGHEVIVPQIIDVYKEVLGQ